VTSLTWYGKDPMSEVISEIVRSPYVEPPLYDLQVSINALRDSIRAKKPTDFVSVEDRPEGWALREQCLVSNFPVPMKQVFEQCGINVVNRESDSKKYDALLPDPAHLKSTCEANGIPITLVSEANEEGEIPGDIYEKVVRSGRHPVGIDNWYYYMHDIGYGGQHLLAAAIGGTSLIEWLNGNSHYPIVAVYDQATFHVTKLLEGALQPENRFSNSVISGGVRRVIDVLTNNDRRGNRADRPRLAQELGDILHAGLLERAGIDCQHLHTTDRIKY